MTDTPVVDPEQIKADAVAAAKQALIDSLQGSKPKYSWETRGTDAPANYDELFDEVKKQTPSLTEEQARAAARSEFEKLEAEREAKRITQEEETKKQKASEIEAKQKNFDAEWYDLVKEGKMPAVAPEIQERINKGEALTKEEILADEGLKARLELAQVSVNKSAKLAFYEDYNKEQPGAGAPVLGTRPTSRSEESQELDYDRDVVPNRKKVFGW